MVTDEGQLHRSAHRVIGLAGAAIWLGGVGGLFAMLALAFTGTLVGRLSIFGVLISLAWLVVRNVSVIRAVRRLVNPVPPSTPAEQINARRFKWVIIAEVAAIAVVNIVCTALGYYDLMTPLDVLIVGLHFLPLAWIFRVPRYYAMGTLFCTVVILTMLLVDATAHIGPAPAWFVFISVGCGTVAVLTAAANTLEVSRAVRGSRVSEAGA